MAQRIGEALDARHVEPQVQAPMILHRQAIHFAGFGRACKLNFGRLPALQECTSALSTEMKVTAVVFRKAEFGA
ncbi:hypothetical protein G7047_00250 [Diaphorobacter sp. HDW4A]|uniref:hypothetical protein n=1 Tax=Diaphorobacter sp. HDW4A TaxID=2714924 RepID=UPI00140B4E19|nr:hypothetical protein [Diaphorobacter sp. HDW4A]QIL78523.1 hypothetical protein G7047_00250 [Diaphorobacter sp. HDW4A]